MATRIEPYQLDFTPYSLSWVKGRPQLWVAGRTQSGKGFYQLLQLQRSQDPEPRFEFSSLLGLKASSGIRKITSFDTIGSVPNDISMKTFASASFTGEVSIWTLENLKAPVFSSLHNPSRSILVNDISLVYIFNSLSIISAGRDGKIQIFDIRTPRAPSVSIQCVDPNQNVSDVWSITTSSSNSHQLFGGTNHGLLYCFDLRNIINSESSINVGVGICSLSHNSADYLTGGCLKSTLFSLPNVSKGLSPQQTDPTLTLPEPPAISSKVKRGYETVWSVKSISDSEHDNVIFAACDRQLARISIPRFQSLFSQVSAEASKTPSIFSISPSPRALNSVDVAPIPDSDFVCAASTGFASQVHGTIFDSSSK